MVTLFTVGHSTRTLDAFRALLERSGVQHVADVRRFPTSRRHPHFDREALAAALASWGMTYSHHPALGGRRPPRPDSGNAAWRNAGFRGYADYMQTAEFAAALDALLEGARARPTAIMCAEAVPWRCHRSLIADAAAVRQGWTVRHILDAGPRAHHLPAFAVARGGVVTYPDPVIGSLQPRLL